MGKMISDDRKEHLFQSLYDWQRGSQFLPAEWGEFLSETAETYEEEALLVRYEAELRNGAERVAEEAK